MLPKAKEHNNRRAWLAIVKYANAGDAHSFKKAFLRSLAPVSSLTHTEDLQRQIVESLIKGRKESEEEAFSRWAMEYHQQIRAALTWLCLDDSKRYSVDEGPMRFLETEGNGLRMFVKATRVVSTDKRGRRKFDLILAPQLESCRSIITPVCRFMWDRLWEHEEGVQEAMPIGICERENCGRFMVEERSGRKRFCSDGCRRAAFQSSRDDWSEYMRTYRRRKKRQMKAKKK